MKHRVASTLLALALVAFSAGATQAQDRPDLRLEWEDGPTESVALTTDRGYAAVPAATLERLGWAVAVDGSALHLEGPTGDRLELRAGSPFFRWDGRVLQLADPVYQGDGGLFVPAQLVTDFLPRRFADLYSFVGPTLTLHTAIDPRRPGSSRTTTGEPATDASGPPADPERPSATPSSPYDGTRVVIIDAGHGGRDPGSISDSGIREKTVALEIALAVARELRGREDLEVHLIRDDDTFVPLWNRGIQATRIKGDRPGLFLSVHANSFTNAARGFETYFLSEARTEDERRVAAMENAPLRLEQEAMENGDDLGFILRELRNLDHAHWSALLAELAQEELDRVHSGPNRGVKQAPLAVLTNSLMPSVLVEVGYLSHPQEAQLLARKDFQDEAGRALADAILRFFERFPPGASGPAGAGR